MTQPHSELLTLTGLTAAPSQVCGSLRLVPLIRQRECHDVRLERRPYGEDLTQVRLERNLSYWAFVPHGLVLRWNGDTNEVAAGGQLRRADGTRREYGWLSTRTLERLVRRVDEHALRFLPLHTALEGFLELHFGGPRTRWPEYSRETLRWGLGERAEQVYPGRSLYGFEEALRRFEIHTGQVGVLVFVADQLAGASVVPSSADYRRLHSSLLTDVYGELIWRYAVQYDHAGLLEGAPDLSGAGSLSDIRAALEHARRAWADFALGVMSAGLLTRPVQRRPLYQAGDLRLERFIAEIDLNGDNHIGELLTRPDGEVLYLKTYLLSQDQARRVRLLEALAVHDWHFDRTAGALGLKRHQLSLEFGRLGFAYLLRPHLLEEAERLERQLRT